MWRASSKVGVDRTKAHVVLYNDLIIVSVGAIGLGDPLNPVESDKLESSRNLAADDSEVVPA
jgi:hypothetical protein